MRIVLASVLAGMLCTQPVRAACVDGAPAPPPELLAWCTPVPAAAAPDAKSLVSAKLDIGRAYTATLESTAGVHYIVPPEKPGDSVSFGGLFTFEVVHAGNHRVALSSGAWIDLLRDGKAVTSTNHGHGPDGSGIRKMVDFPLTPGRHTLQLAASAEAGLTLLIVRLP